MSLDGGFQNQKLVYLKYVTFFCLVSREMIYCARRQAVITCVESDGGARATSGSKVR